MRITPPLPDDMEDKTMRLVLAPMEGMVDYRVRRLLCALGGFDQCVTEFIRVSQTRLPRHVFEKYCPELTTGGHSSQRVPVLVQLMGHDPAVMADNAAAAAALGAPGIDLNFGCPSKTVNRRAAGASLLQWPRRIETIVRAVRAAVPAAIPVSAKIRLGYADSSLYLDNALAVAAGGANHLTVHARTKAQGYRPPAHWDYIARIRTAVPIPVCANGDIWTVADFARCREITGCQSFMLGRGALARPDLALRLRAATGGAPHHPWSWARVCGLLADYMDLMAATGTPASVRAGRLKQWTAMLKRGYPEAGPYFNAIKRETDAGRLLEHTAALAAAA